MADNNLTPLGGEELDGNNRPIKDGAVDRALKSILKSYKGNDPRVEPIYEGTPFLPEYDKGRIPGISQDQVRNFNQSFGEMAGRFLAQGLGGEFIGGSIEGTGYLLGLVDDFINPHKEAELQFDNYIAQTGRQIKEYFKDEYPIYEADPGSLSPSDPAYWFSNGTSVFTTLSLMAPSMGVAAGVGKLGKVVKTLSGNKAFKITNDILDEAGNIVKPGLTVAGAAQILTAATANRHMESMMESAQTYDDVLQRLTNSIDPDTQSPFTAEKAKKYAADAAATTYDWNWLAMATDIPQYAMMFRGVKFAKTAAKSKAKAALKKIGALGGTAASEGFEELYQHNVQEEALRNALISSGLEDEGGLGFAERILVNSTSDQGVTSAMIGAISGGGQQVVGRAFKKAYDKFKNRKGKTPEEQAAIEKIVKQVDTISKVSTYNAAMLHASEVGNKEMFDFFSTLSNLDIKLDNIRAGNLDVELDRLDNHLEQATQGLDEEQTQALSDNIETIKSDLREMDKLYSSVKEEYAGLKATNKTEILDSIVHDKLMLKRTKANVGSVNEKIAELEKEYPKQLNEQTSNLRDLKEEQSSYKLWLDDLNKEKEVAKTDALKAIKDKQIAKVSQKLKAVETKIAKAEKEEGVTDYEDRSSMDFLKYKKMRTEEMVSNLNSRVNSYKNKNFVSKLDNNLTEVKERNAAQDQIVADDREGKESKVSLDLPATDWEDADQRRDAFSKMLEVFSNDEQQGENIGQSISGEDMFALSYPKLDAFVTDLINNIDNEIGRDRAYEILGKGYPKVGAKEAEGIELQNKPGLLWKLDKNSPSNTMKYLNGIFRGVTGQQGETLDKIKQIIIDTIEGTVASDKATAALEVTKTSSETDVKVEEKTTKKKKVSLETNLPSTTTLYNTPTSSIAKTNPILEDIFNDTTGGKFGGWNWLNSPDGLQVGDEIRIYIPDPNNPDELNTSKKLNLQDFYKNNKVTANNVPIYIQAKVKGRWEDIGQIPDLDNWKKKNSNKALWNDLNSQGRGPAQLQAIREYFFDKKNNAPFYSKNVKTTVRMKKGAIQVNNPDDQRTTILTQAIKDIFYRNRIILAAYDSTGYFINNEDEVYAEMSGYNQPNIDGQLDAHLGRVHLIVKDVNGSPRPVILSTNKMGDVDGAVEAVMSRIEKIRNAKNEEVKTLKNEIEEITYHHSNSLGITENHGFYVHAKDGVKFSYKDSEDVIQVKWSEFEERKNEIIDFLKQKPMQFNKYQSNLEGKYTRLFGETKTYDSYNEYVAENIVNTNFTGLYENTRIEIEDPLGTKPTDRQDDETAVEVKEEVKEDIKPATEPKRPTVKGSTLVPNKKGKKAPKDKKKPFDPQSDYKLPFRKVEGTPILSFNSNKEELEWIQKHLPQVPVVLAKKLIEIGNKGGERAYGYFQGGLIYMHEHAEVGTGYHEAFHAVFRMYASDKQQEKLMLEAQSLFGVNDNAYDIEEALAEAFRNYKLGIPFKGVDLNKGKSLIRRFFDELIRMTKLILRMPLTIDEYFKTINNKTFTSKDLKRDVSEFEAVPRLIPGYRSSEQNEVVQYLTKALWIKIKDQVERGVAKSLEDANIANAFQEIRDEVVAFSQDEEMSDEQIESFSKIDDNFDLLVDEVLKVYKTFGLITMNEDKLWNEEDMMSLNTSHDSEAQIHDKPHFESSAKDKASLEVKRYIAFDLSTGEEDELGFDKGVDFHKAYSYIALTTAGSRSLPEMINRLKERSEYRTYIDGLVYDLENGNENFKSAFYSTFANQQMRFLTMSEQGGQTTLYTTNRRNVERVILEEWRDAFERGPYSYKDKGEAKPNMQLLEKEYTSLQLYVKDLFSRGKEELSEEDYKRIKGYYSVLGIDMPMASIKYKTKAEDMGKFLRNKVGLENLMGRVVKNKVNPFNTDPRLHEGTSLKSIARMASYDRVDVFTATTKGLKNKQKHSLTGQSFISNLFDTLKTKPEQALAVLYRYYSDPYYSNETKSALLRLFEGEFSDGKFKPTNEQAIKDFDWATMDAASMNGRIVEYADMDPSERLQRDVEMFLRKEGKEGKWGWFSIPIPNDKSNSIDIKLPKVSVKKALEYLEEQAKSEWHSIHKALREVTEGDPSYIEPKDRIKNYHYTSNPEVADGGAFSFVMFPSLNDIFIKNGKVSNTWNSNAAKEAIKTMLQTEASQIEAKLTAKDGYRLIWHDTDIDFDHNKRPVRGSTRLNRESLKDYILPMEKGAMAAEIDVRALSEDFTANALVWTNEMYRILHGNPAYYGAADKLNKRSNQVISVGRRARVADWGVKPNINSLVVSEVMKDFLNEEYKDVSIADAQGYITLDYYVRYLKGLGEWYPEHEKALQDLKEGKPVDSIILKPLKFFTYELQKVNGRMVPIQIKHSVMPLIPRMVKGTELEKLANFMTEKGIDEVNFAGSGFKFGTRRVINSFDEMYNIDNIDDWKVVFSNENRMIVKETDSKSSSPKFNPQVRKISMSNINDSATYEIGNETLTGAQIKERFHKLVNDNLKMSSAEVEALIKDPVRLSKVLKRQFRDRGLPDNAEKMLELTKDGKFKYGLSFPSLLKKVENILNALYRNNVTVQRMFGYNAYQVSGFKFNENLKFMQKDSRYAEIMISARMFKQFGGDITKVEDAFKEGILYRTPVQAKSSMLPFKVVGVLPEEAGDIAVLPLEVVKQMGSDFDIDSVSIHLKDPNAKKGSIAANNNKMIELMYGVLSSPKHFEEVTKPIHNDTILNKRKQVLARKLGLDLRTKEGKAALKNRYSFRNTVIGSPMTQHNFYVSNMSGKALIGMIEPHIMHHAVSTQVPYQLNIPLNIQRAGETGTTEVTRLGEFNNKEVADALQQLMNIAVDNTNDPVAGDLNINRLTIGPLVTLVRAGMSLDSALDFISHPVTETAVRNAFKFRNWPAGIKGTITELGLTELMEEASDKPLTSKAINSVKEGDYAIVANMLLNLTRASRGLGFDIRDLQFDASGKVGATLYEKEAYTTKMSQGVEFETDEALKQVVMTLQPEIINNVITQATGYASYMGFYEHGVLDPLRVIGEIIPTAKKAFSTIHEALLLDNNKSDAKEIATYAFMNYTFTLPESPIKGIFSLDNRNRLLKGEDSLWNRMQQAKKDYPQFSDFLNVFQHENRKGLDYILFNGTNDWTKDEKSNLSADFLEMFWNSETRELAKDLAEYAQMTNGYSYSRFSFTDIIPLEYFTDITFSGTEVPILDYWKSVESKLDSRQYPNLSDFVPKFIENFHNLPALNGLVSDYTSLYEEEREKTQSSIKEGGNYITVASKKFEQEGEKIVVPMSVIFEAKALNPKDLHLGYIKITRYKGENSYDFLLRYGGQTADGKVIFNLATGRGDYYRMQEWTDISAIDSNNYGLHNTDYFFMPDSFEKPEFNTMRLDDEPSVTFKDMNIYSDPLDEEFQPATGNIMTEEMYSSLKEKLAPPMYQLDSTEYKEANEKLDNAIKVFLKQHGIKVESVDSITTRNGNSAVAAADLINKVIKVAKGEAKIDTLAEEAGHFFVDILGDKHPLVRRMWYLVQSTQTYKEVFDKYYDVYDGSEESIVKEAIGQVIAKEIVLKFEQSEQDKGLVKQIKAVIKNIINRIKSIFSKVSEEKFNEQIDPFKIAAEMILGNDLSLHRARSVEEIMQDVKDDVETGRIDKYGVENIGTKEFYSLKDRPKTLNDVVKDPTVAQAEKISAILDKALDTLIKRANKMKRVGIEEKANELKSELKTLEELIERKQGAYALARFVKNSAYIINDAYKRAERVRKYGNETLLKNNRRVATELNMLYDTASAYNFLDQVLSMSMKQESDAQIKAIRALVSDLKDKKDEILSIYQSSGKVVFADFLSRVGSAFYSEEEILGLLQMGEKDITWTDRMLRAMSQVDEPILQLIDKAVVSAKNNARLDARTYNEELAGVMATVSNNPKRFEAFIEKLNGKATGYFVSQYIPEYYAKRKEAVNLVKEAKKLEAEGNISEADAKRKEAQTIFNEIEEVTTIDEFNEIRVPKAEYINKNFETIKKDPVYKALIKGMRDATNSLPVSKRKLYDRSHDRFRIPAVKKGLGARFMAKGFDALELNKAIKYHQKENVKLDENDNPIGEVPVFFIEPMDIRDMSFDLAANVQLYYNMARQAGSISNIIDYIELGREVMRTRKIKQTRGGKVLKSVFGRNEERVATLEGGYAFDRLEDYIKANIYGKGKQEGAVINVPGYGEVDLQKAASKWLQLNGVTMLSTNIFAAVANPIVGDMLQQIESFSAEHFKAGAYAEATAIYGLNMAGLVEDIATGKNRNKINALNEVFDVIQEYTSFEANLGEVTNKYGNIFSGKSLMALQNLGEHWIQSRLGISMLLSKTYDAKEKRFRDKEKGEKSAWEQLEVKGDKVFLNGVNINTMGKQAFTDLTLQIRNINQQLHGNYTDIDRSAAHQTIVGQLAFQFRNWMVAGYDRRWGKTRGSERSQTVLEGNYRTALKFMQALGNDVLHAKFNVAATWDNFMEAQEDLGMTRRTSTANMRRTMLEMVYMASLLILINTVFALGSDDDDDSWAWNFMAYQANRLYTELAFYSDITETTKLLKSPAASINQWEKVTQLFQTVVSLNFNDRYESGSRKGELKIKKLLSDLTPFWRDVDRVQHVEDLLQFFN